MVGRSKIGVGEKSKIGFEPKKIKKSRLESKNSAETRWKNWVGGEIFLSEIVRTSSQKKPTTNFSTTRFFHQNFSEHHHRKIDNIQNPNPSTTKFFLTVHPEKQLGRKKNPKISKYLWQIFPMNFKNRSRTPPISTFYPHPLEIYPKMTIFAQKNQKNENKNEVLGTSSHQQWQFNHNGS